MHRRRYGKLAHASSEDGTLLSGFTPASFHSYKQEFYGLREKEKLVFRWRWHLTDSGDILCSNWYFTIRSLEILRWLEWSCSSLSFERPEKLLCSRFFLSLFLYQFTLTFFTLSEFLWFSGLYRIKKLIRIFIFNHFEIAQIKLHNILSKPQII